jgi:hypothetical protein
MFELNGTNRPRAVLAAEMELLAADGERLQTADERQQKTTKDTEVYNVVRTVTDGVDVFPEGR